jgi:probable HAF family extracellular repeat protein
MRLGSLCAALLAAGSPLPAFAQATFTGIGDLPGGPFSSVVSGLSGNGLVVVGRGVGASDSEAVRWSAAGGLVGLGDLPGGAATSFAFGTNADGSVVVGFGVSASGVEAFRWTQAGGMVGLGDLPGGIFGSEARAVSADGLVVVGRSRSGPSDEAFRWTQAGGMVGLGDLPGGQFQSFALGVSADGTVIVGQGESASGAEAFRWTQAGGMVGLGDLAGGGFSSSARAVSADGLVVVGEGTTALGGQAFRWTQATGMVGLGLLPGGTESQANAVSGDGAIIVGYADTPTSGEAVRWTQDAGLQTVRSYLASQGVNVGTWQLTDATGISTNGSVIAGNGINPSGADEGWIASGLGLLSASVIQNTLTSAAGAPAVVQQIALAQGKGALETGKSFGRGAFNEPVGGVSFFGHVDMERFDAFAGDHEWGGDGTLGLAWRASDAVRLGLAGRWGRRDADLFAYDSELRADGWGFNAFATYEPGTEGLRLYLGASADKIDADIARGYLNGVTPVIARGETGGWSYGAALEAAWAFDAGAVTIQPFAGWQIAQVSLDGYSDVGGAFPATFDDISKTTHLGRLGAEMRGALCDKANFFVSANWAHQFDDTAPAIAGVLSGVNLPFTTALGVEQDWAEGAIGASWRPSAGTLLRASLGASSDGKTAPDLNATLGFAFSF